MKCRKLGLRKFKNKHFYFMALPSVLWSVNYHSSSEKLLAEIMVVLMGMVTSWVAEKS